MYSINELIDSLKEVPAMPNIIMHALNVMKDPNSSTKELAKIISYDQSLSTKVLSLVNSSYYGFPQQITSIARALTLIGMSNCKSIIFAVAMRPMLINSGDKELWKHSIKTAVGCEYMAKHLKLMDPDEAFVVGFLHDLGKIILNMKDAKTYEKVQEIVKSGSNVIEVERMFFGTDHPQMGSLLAKKWQLPILVANAIKYHHDPLLSSMPAMCTLIYVVDRLVQDWTEESTFDEEIMKNIDIKIEQPMILRENILAKAEMLLNELSN